MRHFGLTAADEACIKCHSFNNPGLTRQWEKSLHSMARVGCMACHQAKQGDFDAMDHNGYVVGKNPRAVTCQKCHPRKRSSS